MVKCPLWLYLPKFRKKNLIQVQFLLKDHIIVADYASMNEYLHGQGTKSYLIVWAAPVQDAPMPALLPAIMQAIGVQLDTDAFTLALPPDKRFSIARLLAEKPCTNVFVFGAAPSQLGLKCEVVNNAIMLFLGANFLFTDTLAELEANKDKKMALWAELKKL
jgi:hypothetical protein